MRGKDSVWLDHLFFAEYQRKVRWEMKKIYWRILILFAAVTVCLLLVSVTDLVKMQWKQEDSYLGQILEDTRKFLDDAEIKYAANQTSEVQNGAVENSETEEKDGSEENRSFIEETIRNIPTDRATILFCVDVETGALLGMTENNISETEMIQSTDWGKVLKKLENMEDGQTTFIRLNNAYTAVSVIWYRPEILLVGLNTGESFSSQIRNSIFHITAGVFISCMLVVILIKKFLKQFFLTDIDKIKREVTHMLEGKLHSEEGELETEFDFCQSEETELLASAIRELENGYVHKTERMNKIFNSISPHISAFELLDNPRQNFFSDNFASVMGLSREEAQYYKENTESFKELVRKLTQRSDKGNIVPFRGKYLEVHVFEIQTEVVGVFIDRTVEETERHRLTSYIRNEQKKSMMDDLTGIMNRKGFQRTVEKILQKDGVNAGVLMVCDLDNFKSVNDSLGHPEGDFVLKLFADVLKKEFRKSDVIGRIGGDEFMIFLPNAVGDLALRKKLDHFMDSVRGRLSAYRKYELSVSVGVSRIDADTGVMDFRKLYEKYLRHVQARMSAKRGAGSEKRTDVTFLFHEQLPNINTERIKELYLIVMCFLLLFYSGMAAVRKFRAGLIVVTSIAWLFRISSYC